MGYNYVPMQVQHEQNIFATMLQHFLRVTSFVNTKYLKLHFSLKMWRPDSFLLTILIQKYLLNGFSFHKSLLRNQLVDFT